MASCDPSTLANQARCFLSCHSSPRAIKSYLLCLYANLPTGPVFDPDAAAFFARALTLTDAQKTAVNTLVLALKAANLWTKMDVIYPFVGGTAATHSLNLKANAFNIVWSAGGVTHNANGITGDGATGYGNSTYTPSTAGGVWILNSAHLCVYNEVNVPNAGFWFASFNNHAGQLGVFALPFITGALNADGGGAALNEGAMKGVAMSTRTAANATKSYFNADTNVDATASTALADGPLVLLARGGNTFPPPVNFSNTTLGFASAGSGLVDADYTALNAAVTAYNNSLGR